MNMNKAKFIKCRNNFLANLREMKSSGIDHAGLQELCIDVVREMVAQKPAPDLALAARREIFAFADYLMTEGFDVSAALPGGIS